MPVVSMVLVEIDSRSLVPTLHQIIAIMSERMKTELKDAVFEVEDLDKVLFPDSKLPFTITEAVLDAVPWVAHQSRAEVDMAAWLNSVVEALVEHTGKDALRKWDPCMMDKFVAGSNIERKADLVVVDKSFTASDFEKEGKPNWKEFHAYTDVTSQPKQYELHQNTWHKSLNMFEALAKHSPPDDSFQTSSSITITPIFLHVIAQVWFMANRSRFTITRVSSYA